MKIWSLLFGLLLSTLTLAHEVRPASLSLIQTAAEQFDVTWRVPARGDQRMSLYVQFDPKTQVRNLPTAKMAGGYYVERWRISHPDDLRGSSIAIEGLASTMTDALIRIRWLDGGEQVSRLLPNQTQLIVEEKSGVGETAITYFALGVEHIVLGFDHLLFVLALILLVTGRKSLLVTITAFTLAHSIALALAVLGMISVPQNVVEVLIALSIVFLATEILHKRQGLCTLAIRKPWLVAFGFGLIHGLGFAGALSEIGVPQHAIAVALALFNLGVEAGQLAFIAGVCSLVYCLRRFPQIRHWEARANHSLAAISMVPTAYFVGGLAAWWLIDRTVALMI